MSPPWNLPVGSGPLIATAVHHGHDLRPSIAALIRLSEADRLREEDPHTGQLAAEFRTHVVVQRSRFEVDLNRPRDGSVYIAPEDAWELHLWDQPLPDQEVQVSRDLYDRFHAELASIIERTIAEHGFFVVYDIHSFNHRRPGADAPPEDVAENPSINLGTGSLPDKWRAAADTFMHAMAADELDVRENIKFEGGHLSRWVHERYGDDGCALAIEFKKEFMDEWTGELVAGAIEILAERLAGTAPPVLATARRT